MRISREFLPGYELADGSTISIPLNGIPIIDRRGSEPKQIGVFAPCGGIYLVQAVQESPNLVDLVQMQELHSHNDPRP